jgi:hypothetical protein
MGAVAFRPPARVLALRHQLQVLQRTRPRRVRLAKMDRWLWALLLRTWVGRVARVSITSSFSLQQVSSD